jgi:hypothetical protein
MICLKCLRTNPETASCCKFCKSSEIVDPTNMVAPASEKGENRNGSIESSVEFGLQRGEGIGTTDTLQTDSSIDTENHYQSASASKNLLKPDDNDSLVPEGSLSDPIDKSAHKKTIPSKKITPGLRVGLFLLAPFCFWVVYKRGYSWKTRILTTLWFFLYPIFILLVISILIDK